MVYQKQSNIMYRIYAHTTMHVDYVQTGQLIQYLLYFKLLKDKIFCKHQGCEFCNSKFLDYKLNFQFLKNKNGCQSKMLGLKIKKSNLYIKISELKVKNLKLEINFKFGP